MNVPQHISRPVLLLPLCLLLGLGGGWIGAALQDRSSLNSFSVGDSSRQKQIVTSESQLYNDIANSVGKSVVSVNVTGQSTSGYDFFGFYSGSTATRSAGTGIIISSDGLIMTNRHVVPTGTTKVSVTLSDGTQLSDVEVVGRTSENDNLDVAFLRVKDTKGKKLHPARLGDSSKVQVGDAVVAIGNALGQFQNTVTSGIISGFGRSVQASSGGTGLGAENLDDLFQTDAAINEGNSGGPLVNMNGEVIGINTAIAGNAQNIGFAIPMNDVSGLIKQIIQTGKIERPYLGVRYIPLTPDVAEQYNLSVLRGAYIVKGPNGEDAVVTGSPADKAGIQEKDIITKVNDVKVDESRSLTSLLSQHQPGDKVSLTVLRKGKTLHLDATLSTLKETSQ